MVSLTRFVSNAQVTRHTGFKGYLHRSGKWTFCTPFTVGHGLKLCVGCS